DIISVSPNGDISVWDSKWRRRPQSIGNAAGAHQTELSLKTARKLVDESVQDAIRSGRIPPNTIMAQKVSENAGKGNFTINTVGTGDAHGGVVTCVRDGAFADCWSN